MFKKLFRRSAASIVDLPLKERLSIFAFFLVWLTAMLLCDAFIYPHTSKAAQATGRVYYRSGGEAPSRISVQFERTCSFNVVLLAAGTYDSEANVVEKLNSLWSEADARSKNLALYGHRIGDCKAASRAVGYRFTWTTSTLNQFRQALAGTNRASSAMVNKRIRLVVTQPIWLSGEIAQAVQFSRAR